MDKFPNFLVRQGPDLRLGPHLTIPSQLGHQLPKVGTQASTGPSFMAGLPPAPPLRQVVFSTKYMTLGLLLRKPK